LNKPSSVLPLFWTGKVWNIKRRPVWYKTEKSPYLRDTGDYFFFRIRIKRIKDLIIVHLL